MRTDSNKHTKGAVPGRLLRLHFGTPLRAKVLAQPLQIRLAAGLNLDYQEFRSLVTMKLLQPGFESRQLVGRSLQQKQGLV